MIIGNPKISVVIPVYNGGKTLIATLKSVLNQTYKNIEIIVVDDGSEIPIQTILPPRILDYVQIIRMERGNANIARNQGILNASGDYIAMLDADDLWLENHLETSLDLLLKSGCDGLYGSIYLSADRQNKVDECSIIYAKNLQKEESMIDYVLSSGCGAQTSTLFTTAESMKNILWDPQLINHQDYDFVVRFHEKYKIIAKIEPTVIYFSRRKTSIHYDSCINFIQKNIIFISPEIYNNYHLNMYIYVNKTNAHEKIIKYYQQEATRYKTSLSYHKYISILNPQKRKDAIYYKWAYLWSVLNTKISTQTNIR